MSQSNTIQAPDPDDDKDIRGEFIGFTVEGGPIIHFTNSFEAGSLPDNSELLGYCNDDRPIVAYRKDSIRFIGQDSDADDDEVELEKGKGKSKKIRRQN